MELDCNKLIDSVILQYTDELNTQGIKLTINFEKKVPLYSDMARLRTVLSNLFLNAIQFQDPGKKIKVISISIRISLDSFMLSISDNGIGIETKNHRKIFQLFFRANEKSTGTGAGLYVVNEIVSKMKGTIVVDSSPGQGSIFKITVPNMAPGRV